MGNRQTNSRHPKSRIILDYETDNGRRGLGDIIISTPIITALAHQYKTKIGVILREAARPLLQHHPYVAVFYAVDDIINSDLHLVMGFRLEQHIERRNNQPRVDAMAALFGVTLIDKQPQIYYPEVEKLPRSIGISIESTNPVREWQGNYLVNLIQQNNDYDWHVFGQKPIALPRAVNNHLGKLDLFSLIQKVHQMEFFVTVDSLFSHLTAALGIPTIVMYTEVPKEWRCSYYPKTIGIQAPVDCSPCWERQHPNLKTKIEYCYNQQNNGQPIKCVESFTPEIISKAINDYFV